MFEENLLDGYKLKSRDQKYIKINEKIFILCKNYFSVMNNYLNDFSHYEQKYSSEYKKLTPMKIIEVLESQNSIIKELISLLNEFFAVDRKPKKKIYPLFICNHELKINAKTRPKTPVKRCDTLSYELSTDSVSPRNHITKNSIRNLRNLNKYYNPNFLNSFLNGVESSNKNKNSLSKNMKTKQNISLNNYLGDAKKIKSRNKKEISSFGCYSAINTTYDDLLKKSSHSLNPRKNIDITNITTIKSNKTISNVKPRKEKSYFMNRNIRKMYNLSKKLIEKYNNY